MGKRVLWLSDGGCNTGFGVVTHQIGERLVRDYGYEVHVLATNHRGDAWPSILDPSVQTPLRLYRPTIANERDIYGKTRVLELLDKLNPDAVVMVNDPKHILHFLFENQFDLVPVGADGRPVEDEANAVSKVHALLHFAPILTYVPCDGTNLPPAWTTTIPSVSRMLAMSRWGLDVYGLPDDRLVYHGVDTETFHPVSRETPITIEGTGQVITSKREAKRLFGFDTDGFLVLRVDANSGRKDYAATVKALIPFMERHADVQAHFHGPVNNGQSGVDLAALWSRTPHLAAGTRWFAPSAPVQESFAGWPVSHLAALYNAADIFVSTSRGEGFGLTLAEAAACGVPIVAQNVSAIPEVVGSGGILIEPERLLTVPSGEDTWLADIDAFTAAFERLYASAGLRRDLGRAGRAHVEASFSWDAAAERFDAHLEALATRQSPTLHPVGATPPAAGMTD